ncbi:MAG: hypothetical protein E6H02_03490 [Bacillati bacterium ANGP1]|uniref:D-aminoacyl-tRNA deacylase n=1 Tax=Candidatus Segetimicrobium genomatis TaxID=2569760 RepID=A0A537M1Z4_9BACT|nr:MAG: hypothetical protein E6H02_03490 [Terrabacteria group bacterium ANGP1]
MRALVQRVGRAEVRVGGASVGRIGTGMVVLLGVGTEDTAEDATGLAARLAHLHRRRSPERAPVHPVRRYRRGPAAELRPRGAARAGGAAVPRVQSRPGGPRHSRGARPVPRAHGGRDPQRWPRDDPPRQPRAMMSHVEFWELTAWGAGVGGAGVWGLAVAARVGWLRALLDLFPRFTWEWVTWGVIPALLTLPVIVQGAAVAAVSSRRPVPAARGIAGSAAGSLVAVVAIALGVLAGVRHLPGSAAGRLAVAAPVPLILGCGALLLAGGLRAAGRLLRSIGLRRAAVPTALLAAAGAWALARPSVLAAAYVLDRAEVVVFFVAVVVGGSGGAAWGAGAPPGVARGGRGGSTRAEN